MTLGNSSTNTIRFAALPGPHNSFFAIPDHNGKTIYVEKASIIQLIAQALHKKYEVIVTNKSDLLLRISRNEGDITVHGIFVEEEAKSGIFKFSYPTSIRKLSFLTSKPEHLSKNLALVDPFSYELWVCLLIAIFMALLIVYILLCKKVNFETLFVNLLGNVLQQPLSFKMTRGKVRLFLFTWLLSVMVVSNGYKAVLLSFLTVPYEFAIRDISDLHMAILKHPVECFSRRRSIQIEFLHSNIESWRAVGTCLKRTHDQGVYRLEHFPDLRSKKAFIDQIDFLRSYEDHFLISEDFFYTEMDAYVYTARFCCPNDLNKAVHRLFAAGLIQKYSTDLHFLIKLGSLQFIPPKSDLSVKIGFDDISGAFYILAIGYVLALITLIVEISVKKCTLKSR